MRSNSTLARISYLESTRVTQGALPRIKRRCPVLLTTGTLTLFTPRIDTNVFPVDWFCSARLDQNVADVVRSGCSNDGGVEI